MDDKKKLSITIIGGLAVLFFLITRFCLPVAKDNRKRSAEYKRLKLEVETLGEFSKDELDSLGSRVDTAISNLEKRLPAQGKLKLMEQLARTPTDSNIVFTGITRRSPKELQGYQVFPVDVNVKASFYDLIKYLAGIETGPLLIGINSLSLRKVEPEARSLDVRATFWGFRVTHRPPPISKYMREKYTPIDKRRFERVFEPVKLMESKRAVLRLKDYNPFVYGLKERKIEYPELKIGALSLKGILRIGDKKVALINENVVREGERIAGMEVVEIQDYKVVLMHSGKRYILKMGVSDEFIKP